jgi:hypothetical protein
MKEDEMGGICSMNGRDEKGIGNVNGRHCLGDVSLARRIT